MVKVVKDLIVGVGKNLMKNVQIVKVMGDCFCIFCVVIFEIGFNDVVFFDWVFFFVDSIDVSYFVYLVWFLDQFQEFILINKFVKFMFCWFYSFVFFINIGRLDGYCGFI